MREWVTIDRLDEAARILVPEFVVPELVGVLEHILRPTHETWCFIPQAEDRVPMGVFSTDSSTPDAVPLCLVCEAVFTQLMPPSIAQEFAESHVKLEHPDVIVLWEHGQPWIPGDPRLN
jgi:hypothetical protein